MTYAVQILPVAVRTIRKLPPEAKRRVEAVIELLYRIEDRVLTVVVVHAGHRRDVCER